MATPKAIKRVAVQLDKERIMQIDWNAMYTIEERITQRRGGAWVSLSELGDMKNLSIADMRTMIWGALIHEDENLTEKQVGAMVHLGNSSYVCDKLGEAMDSDEDKKPAAPGETLAGSNNSKGSLAEAVG